MQTIYISATKKNIVEVKGSLWKLCNQFYCHCMVGVALKIVGKLKPSLSWLICDMRIENCSYFSFNNYAHYMGNEERVDTFLFAVNGFCGYL